MRLYQADTRKPDDDSEIVVPRPPRPEHRRVYTSLAFTAAILAATVVTVYLLFPPRHHLLATTATERHRMPGAWQITTPTPAELRAWVIGVVEGQPPLPPALDRATTVGASVVDVLKRRAALVRLRFDADELTYVVTRARGVSPPLSRRDAELRVIEWRKGPWTIVVVGSDATAPRWRPLVGAP